MSAARNVHNHTRPTLKTIAPGRYQYKDDIVDVKAILPAKTSAARKLVYRMVEKHRALGLLNVGDENTVGVVNFLANAIHLDPQAGDESDS